MPWHSAGLLYKCRCHDTASVLGPRQRPSALNETCPPCHGLTHKMYTAADGALSCHTFMSFHTCCTWGMGVAPLPLNFVLARAGLAVGGVIQLLSRPK